MIIVQAPQPRPAERPLTDAITILGYAFGWVMIAIGLWFEYLALTS